MNGLVLLTDFLEFPSIIRMKTNLSGDMEEIGFLSGDYLIQDVSDWCSNSDMPSYKMLDADGDWVHLYYMDDKQKWIFGPKSCSTQTYMFYDASAHDDVKKFWDVSELTLQYFDDDETFSTQELTVDTPPTHSYRHTTSNFVIYKKLGGVLPWIGGNWVVSNEYGYVIKKLGSGNCPPGQYGGIKVEPTDIWGNNCVSCDADSTLNCATPCKDRPEENNECKCITTGYGDQCVSCPPGKLCRDYYFAIIHQSV